MAFTPPPQIPQRGARATFSGAVDAFLKWLAALPAQLDAFLARLETIAAGGAFALPYVIQNNADPLGTGGRIIFNNSPNQASAISLDNADSRGIAQKLVFDALFYTGNTNSVKGYLRIVKANDPSKWALYKVLSWGYGTPVASAGTLTVSAISASEANPFGVGDTLMLFPEKSGDKGDTGNADKQVQTAPAPVGGVITVDYRNGNCLVLNPTPGATVTLAITNWPANGTLGEFWIVGSALGAATVNLSVAVNWLRPDGTMANSASFNTNQGATLRTSGEDNILLWGRTGVPTNGKVAR